MDWSSIKTLTFLNTSASLIDQIAGLDASFPPAATHIVNGVLGNDFLSAGFFVMVIRGCYNVLAKIFTHYYEKIISRVYASVEVEEGDQCYEAITKSARNLSVRTSWASFSKSDRPQLIFLPGKGTHVLHHKGLKVNLSISSTPSSVHGSGSGRNHVKQTITLAAFGWDSGMLRMIIQDAMEESYKKKCGKTTVYTSNGSMYWSSSSARSPRSFDSVILSEGLKEELLKDVTTFQESALWYRDRGVPYRRGYLLHGPPGTGKSSFIIALAGYLGMSISIVNLGMNGLSDQQLSILLDKSPPNSILLMEDVDAALVKRKQGIESNPNSGDLTLSGVLNALDGIAAQEGSVVFMTTNHISKLDEALIRPGRCDRKLLFDYADKQMFLKFYQSYSNDLNSNDSVIGKKKLQIDTRDCDRDAMIHKIADQVCEMITHEDRVTTAQLQGFFMLNRNDPEVILEKIPAFLKELAREHDVLSSDCKAEKHETMHCLEIK
ncbi:MAG: P-loop containing nucleoside triphosphate hydrolase protein [Linnemannia elongata]|nr:MAG: P-loop containing nucleoside triphosphate hydrolase protein [Linnemannia elongata]